MKTVQLGQIVEVLEDLYPLELAEEWDNPGLIVGDTSWPVSKVYCAVDPTMETLQAAIDAGAQLLITHHPLYFRATHTVAGSTFRGSIVTKLIENHCGLWVGHTNVDSAYHGQGYAFVQSMNLKDCGPLVPHPEQKSDATQKQEQVGLGRIGECEENITLQEFARQLSRVLPHTESGILISGDLDRVIHKVAVLPGSGDSEIDTAYRSGADVYVTSDLRHHPVLDGRQDTRMAFISTPHAAIEKLIFPYLVQDLTEKVLEKYGMNLSCEITSLNTDPWNMRL